ncbi:hypothetical protein [Paenibacillus senegalensis]|uniref:hypothetical protein n=1 Tax=Paenibacillus senegalensis TaxID=1465766 RepID=UPI00028A3DAF|nr:hypothetical protein [Paenibacillus senegalensis]
MNRLRQRLIGIIMLGLLVPAWGCGDAIPQLTAEEWLEQAVAYVNENALTYAASREVVVSGLQTAVYPELHGGKQELGTRAQLKSQADREVIDPVKWLNRIARVKSGAAISSAANGLLLEVELPPEAWKELLQKEWQEGLQALSDEQEKKKESYYLMLPQEKAGRLEAEIETSLSDARQYLLQIEQTLSADGICKLLIDPHEQKVKLLNLELMLHYGQDDDAKDEKWLAEYSFPA